MRDKRKVLIALLVVLVLVLVIGYSIGAFYYKDRLLNNVSVNGVNVSRMTLDQANKELGKTDSWNKVTIKGEDEDFLDIKLAEIDYKYIDSPGLDKILKDQKQSKWFLSSFKRSKHTIKMTADYNKDKIKQMLDGMENVDIEPINAEVVYSDSANAFVIKPESNSINITREELLGRIEESIAIREDEVDVKENIEKPIVFHDDKSLAEAKDKANKYLDVELKYDFGDKNELVDRSLINQWITFNGSQVDIDPEKVKEYTAELAKKYDTYGKAREFRTNAGENIMISGGSYGWMTQRTKTADELISHIKNGENKTIEPVYSYKALIRNSNDIGNSYVEIDLKRQMVFVYVDGELKVSTPTVTGNISKGYDTPTGVYPLNYKERDATLRGENYASPVSYWMPFNGNIGLHDADWRDTFGGNIYQSNGSHGCINLPPDNARAMFDLVYPGMPVIVH